MSGQRRVCDLSLLANKVEWDPKDCTIWSEGQLKNSSSSALV